MSETPAIKASHGAPDTFLGPDDLVNAMLASRRKAPPELLHYGDISIEGMQRLIRIAYYASQSPNEGRFPRLTLFVPAKNEQVTPLIPLMDDLSLPLLRRIAPTLSTEDHALIVREQLMTLRLVGIAALSGSLTILSFGDQISQPLDRPRGLSVQITGPGELRLEDLTTHVLQAGSVRQETSFINDESFVRWRDELTCCLFPLGMSENDIEDAGYTLAPKLAVCTIWLYLLRKAATLRHGGCFVVLPEPSNAPLRPAFSTLGCNFGQMLSGYVHSVSKSPFTSSRKTSQRVIREQLLLRDGLVSAVNVIANLSATDGCVVFSRQLNLHSFGSMIEVHEGISAQVPCVMGDPPASLDSNTLRSFGARRRSAVRLCQACPDALAFVISQDGDLRVVVRRKDDVRMYDNAAYW